MSDNSAGITESGNSIVYQASVTDNTQEYFNKFDQNVKQSGQVAQQGFRQVDQAVENTSRQTGILTGLVGGLTAALVNMAAQGIQQAVAQLQSFVKGSIDLAARVDTLGVSLNMIGQNAGYSKEELATFEEGVKKMGITTKEAKNSLIQMAQADMDLTQAAKLARVSQDAAVNAGINSSEAFQRILYAIISGQSEILRNLNLTVDFQAEYSKLAATMGKSEKDLSIAEKKQAALNAVLDKGTLIAGTYEAAMGSVGKMVNSLARYYEEIQLQLGKTFQPAYLELTATWTNLIKELLVYLQDNADEIENTALQLAILADSILGVITGMIDMISKSTILNDAIFALGVTFGMTAEQADAVSKSKLSDWLTTLNQAVILAKGTIAGLFAELKLGAQLIDNFSMMATSTLAAVGLKMAGLGDTNAYANMLTAAKKSLEEFNKLANTNPGEVYWNAYNASVKESVDAMNAVTDATNKATEATSKYAEIQAQKLATALSLANAQLKELQKTMDEQAAERAIQKQRKIIEEELNAQWQAEDRVRNHTERIQSIMDGAEEQKKQLVTNAAKAQLSIEEDYRKRLQEIQKDFAYNSDELARRRDAVGMLKLVRDNKRTLEKEKDSYEQRKKDAQKSYEDTLKTIDEGRKKQLESEQKAYAKEDVNLQRSLDRKKQLQDLHDKWEQEDLDRKNAKQLNEMIDHFAGMDAVTQAGLNQLLKTWSTYFPQLEGLIAQHYATIATLATNAANSSYYENMYGNTHGANVPATAGNTGQAGLVSSMLTPTPGGSMRASALDTVPVSRVPSVAAGRSGSYKKIDINIAGNALDPYIQRVLVRNLTEIERNAA